jgi:hypothetical protein
MAGSALFAIEPLLSLRLVALTLLLLERLARISMLPTRPPVTPSRLPRFLKRGHRFFR